MPPVVIQRCLKIESEVFGSEKTASRLVNLWAGSHRGVKAQTWRIQTVREENWEVKAVGQDKLWESGKYKDYLGATLIGIWKGRHLKMTTQNPIGQLAGSPLFSAAQECWLRPSLAIHSPHRDFFILSQCPDFNFGYCVNIC